MAGRLMSAYTDNKAFADDRLEQLGEHLFAGLPHGSVDIVTITEPIPDTFVRGIRATDFRKIILRSTVPGIRGMSVVTIYIRFHGGDWRVAYVENGLNRTNGAVLIGRLRIPPNMTGKTLVQMFPYPIPLPSRQMELF